MPQDMQDALSEGKISEGHTRPLLMLIDRPRAATLFKEIMLKRLTVRDTEMIARRIAVDRVRKKEYLFAPEILEMERELTEALGTRVAIEPKEHGGKLSIDYMSEEDLRAIFAHLAARVAAKNQPAQEPASQIAEATQSDVSSSEIAPAQELDDRSKEEKRLKTKTPSTQPAFLSSCYRVFLFSAPSSAPDMAARERCLGKVEPFLFGPRVLFCLDLYDVAVVELGIKRHHLAVYFSARDMIAEVGVYSVGKVYGCGVRGQVNHIAFRSKHKHAMRKDIAAHRGLKVGVIELVILKLFESHSGAASEP
jgi:hypothetical protein